MALTTCPDCDREISTLAPACPGCGRPMTATTIEATGKGWKLIQLVSFIVCIASALAMFAVQTQSERQAAFYGTVGGFLAYLYGRIGAWWSHG